MTNPVIQFAELREPVRVIVVGIDGTPQSRLALRWAVESAARRGDRVQVIPAYLDETERSPVGGCQAELDAAVTFATERGVPACASGRLVNASPARALLAEALDADLIVLGGRTADDVDAGYLVPVVTAVTARATCPVVVVRGTKWTGPILVGADGTARCDGALSFAFEEAACAQVPVTVVYCRQPLHQYDEASVVASTCVQLEKWLAESIRPYRERYPGTAVECKVVMGRPASALAELTSHCSLVVVGSRRHGRLTDVVLGPVAQELLSHAACPVAVVHQRDRA